MSLNFIDLDGLEADPRAILLGNSPQDVPTRAFRRSRGDRDSTV